MTELRGNQQLNAIADNRMQIAEGVAEAQLKGKVSGCLNTKAPMEANPLLRWPNENLPISDNGARPSFGQMGLAQFVQGFTTTIMDLNLPVFKQAMLNAGCSAGKSVFAEIMTRVEQGRLQWDDAQGLWQIREDAKTDVYTGRSRQQNIESTEQQGNFQARGNQSNWQAGKVERGQPGQFPCRKYNWGYCREPKAEHSDNKTSNTYLHICVFCYSVPGRDAGYKGKTCKFRTF